MSSAKFTIGIDYGTNSVRALVVRVSDGAEIATAVWNYKRGEAGVIVDATNPHLARQHPADYNEGLETAVTEALKIAGQTNAFNSSDVIGIGVDTTGSTPIPVDVDGIPLALKPEFENTPDAMAWLWKDHTSVTEAENITALAAQHRPEYLAKSGGTYSSEWFWSKIWHCFNVNPTVFAAADNWVELADYIPALLADNLKPANIKRSVCAAGHKAMFCNDWGGLPDVEFCGLLAPEIAQLRGRLFDKAYSSDVVAGNLCPQWAQKLGLPEGIPIAVGAFDAHHGAVGSGVQPGVIVKIMGTSTCDITVADKGGVADVPGVCGIVDGSVLPGLLGIEAGQSAVGDIFNWFVSEVCEGDANLHVKLTEEAEKLQPGQSGLLALDWNNGNRTILVDARLTGLLVGQTLHTTRAEIYRALIEATAFGALTIHNRMEEYNVPIERVICCGGIAEKNAFVMQVYADIIGKPLEVSRSSQTCALGAALFGAVAAGSTAGGYDSTEAAQAKMTGVKDFVYQPNIQNHAVYKELYGLYKRLHDTFGVAGYTDSLADVMKKLLDIKQRVTPVE